MDIEQAKVLSTLIQQEALSQIEQIKQKLKSNISQSQAAYNQHKDLEAQSLAEKSNVEFLYQEENSIRQNVATEITQLKEKLSKEILNYAQYLKAQQDILELKRISNLLLIDNELLNSETDFFGKDWYLPICDASFDELQQLMDWTLEQSASWQLIFDESKRFHQFNENTWDISSYLLSSYQYIKDMFVLISPREKLITEIDVRIDFLSKNFKNNQTQLDVYTQKAQEYQANLYVHEQSLKQHQNQLAVVHENLANIKRLLNRYHSSLIENIYLLKFIEYYAPFEQVLKLNEQWCNFLTKPQPMIDANQPSKTYEQICKYQAALSQVISEQQNEINKLKYVEKLQQLQHYNLETCTSKALLEPLLDFVRLAKYLLTQHTELKSHYDLLHGEYFAKHKKILEEKNATVEAKRLALEQERNLLEHKFKNYLGDKTTKGDLSRYLEQRNKTYWWFDFFQTIVSVLISWLTGFISDKAKRTHYVKWQLEPALETYKYTGDNTELSQLLCSQKTPFFKPRTRELHSYHLSLEYMIENIRHDFLNKEQTKVYLHEEANTFSNNSL